MHGSLNITKLGIKTALSFVIQYSKLFWYYMISVLSHCMIEINSMIKLRVGLIQFIKSHNWQKYRAQEEPWGRKTTKIKSSLMT